MPSQSFYVPLAHISWKQQYGLHSLRALQALFLTVDLISDICITREEEEMADKVQNAGYIVSFVMSLSSFTLRHN